MQKNGINALKYIYSAQNSSQHSSNQQISLQSFNKNEDVINQFIYLEYDTVFCGTGRHIYKKHI